MGLGSGLGLPCGWLTALVIPSRCCACVSSGTWLGVRVRVRIGLGFGLWFGFGYRVSGIGFWLG